MAGASHRFCRLDRHQLDSLLSIGPPGIDENRQVGGGQRLGELGRQLVDRDGAYAGQSLDARPSATRGPAPSSDRSVLP